MTIEIISGILTPVPHDGSTQDLVYGVDANGVYLGLVPSAQAAHVADTPPPRGNWRWANGAWLAYKAPAEIAAEIDSQLEAKLAEGVEINGLRYYADPTFSLHLVAFLAAFDNGIVPADGTVSIRTMDKVVRDVGRDELKLIAGTVLAYVQGVYQWAWQQKADAVPLS